MNVTVPLATLVDDDRMPPPEMMGAHLAWLRSSGITDVLVMGTTGEFLHFTVFERQRYLEALLGVNPGLNVMVNIGAAALPDVLALQAHALTQSGVTSLLWMPPFYFPGASVNGLPAMLAAILAHQPESLPFLAYHYPKMSQVEIPPEWFDEFPRLAGLKDTSGDFNRIQALRARFPDKRIHVGTDAQVVQARAIGCDGVIPSMANLYPAEYLALATGSAPAGLQETLNETRGLIDRFTKLPALKAVLATRLPGYTHASPALVLPHQRLSDADRETLLEELSLLPLPSSKVLHAG